MRLRGSHVAVAVVTLAALAMAYADRPIAVALERSYRQSVVWVAVDRIFLGVEPFFMLVAIAGAWLLFSARGRRTNTKWADDVRAIASIGVVALVIAAVLKVVFGRSGPDLAFIRDGIYEFRWFTGEWTPSHGAFPSATAVVTSAIAATLWQRRSPFRLGAALVAAGLSIAVVLQQYHWLSDSLGGVALGLAIPDLLSARLARVGLAGKTAAPYTPL